MRHLIFLVAICFISSVTSVKSKAQDSNAESNRQIAEKFISTLNNKDYDSFISLFSENGSYAEICSGRFYTGKSPIKQYIKATIDGMPDTKFGINSITTDEKQAVVEWTWEATNTVGWPEMNLPATNKKMKLKGVSVMQIENGKIIANRDYWDWNTFIKEIGLQ